MLTDYDFRVTQLRYIKAAINDLPDYRPDGMDVADGAARLTGFGTVRQTYIEKKTAFDLARSGYRQAQKDGHDAVIGVDVAMKSRYRKDAASLSAIDGLIIQDQTAAETIKRMEQMSSLWGKLPDVGTPPAPFVAWQGMDKTAFDKLLGSITTKQKALPNIDQAFQVAEGNLHETDAELADLVAAALVQGRAQFRDGMEREVLDAVPSEPAQQPPAQAEITKAESPSAGTVRLEFDAPHATSFDVLRKKQTDTDYTKVIDDGIDRFYDATGLAAGKYDFKVIGRNSLGEGPESEVATVSVG